MSPQPQWGEVGVIALVPDPWSSVWMDRHHVLTRLANYFHVVWMHQPGWRECLSALTARPDPASLRPANCSGLGSDVR